MRRPITKAPSNGDAPANATTAVKRNATSAVAENSDGNNAPRFTDSATRTANMTTGPTGGNGSARSNSAAPTTAARTNSATQNRFSHREVGSWTSSGSAATADTARGATDA